MSINIKLTRNQLYWLNLINDCSRNRNSTYNGIAFDLVPYKIYLKLEELNLIQLIVPFNLAHKGRLVTTITGCVLVEQYAEELK